MDKQQGCSFTYPAGGCFPCLLIADLQHVCAVKLLVMNMFVCARALLQFHRIIPDFMIQGTQWPQWLGFAPLPPFCLSCLPY